MKKLIAGGFLLLALVSCGNRKSNIDPFASITKEVDSVRHLHEEVVHAIEAPKDSIPQPADGAFTDFLYEFIANSAFQKQRTKFPLPLYDGEDKQEITSRSWRYDSLFVNQVYYTLLFDRDDQLELVNDTSLNSVQFEWFLLDSRRVKRYYFERRAGRWMLESINLRSIEEDENESFVDFFARFSTDSLFQSSHVRQPLAFVTTDPDDDYSILETTVELNQWFAFKPELPVTRLSNINYGQLNEDSSSSKVLVMKGIENGFYVVLYFRRKANGWELYKFEDTSV